MKTNAMNPTPSFSISIRFVPWQEILLNAQPYAYSPREPGESRKQARKRQRKVLTFIHTHQNHHRWKAKIIAQPENRTLQLASALYLNPTQSIKHFIQDISEQIARYMTPTKDT